MDNEEFRLSDKQIADIAKRVEDKFYADVGKTFISKFIWALGIIAAAVAAFLFGRGH